jgi:hypothetical protein
MLERLDVLFLISSHRWIGRVDPVVSLSAFDM